MKAQEGIKSQYRAALEMLRQAITQCPNGLWDSPNYANRFWHIAYHAIYFTHLYLQPTPEALIPWEKSRDELGALGQQQGSDDPVPYTKGELLAYLALCREQMEVQIETTDMTGESGFHWLPCDKLELQFYNIRHLQQHTGELCERLGATGEIEIGWVSRRPLRIARSDRQS